MAFIYDYERLTPFQIKTAYTNEINEYKRKEKALKQVIDLFENNLYIDKAKLNTLKENLCQNVCARVDFATPEFSTDNAYGVALLCERNN